MKNLFSFFMFGICGTALILGCGGSTSSPAPENGPPASDVKPIAVQAKALTKEYDDNELSADAKYKGKLLAVSGKISNIAETFGSITVSLEGHDVVQTVMCTFDDSERPKVAVLKKGGQVTLIGTGNGSTAGLYVDIQKCKIQ
jgi:putative nucleic acid binding protein